MLKEYPAITLYKGATSIVRFDLSNVEMNEGYYVFTMKKNYSKDALKEFIFNEARVYDTVFDCDFTNDLNISTNEYVYDIMHHIGGERFPICEPTQIIVKYTVGGMLNE